MNFYMLTQILENYDIESDYDGDKQRYTVTLTNKANIACHRMSGNDLEDVLKKLVKKVFDS